MKKIMLFLIVFFCSFAIALSNPGGGQSNADLSFCDDPCGDNVPWLPLNGQPMKIITNFCPESPGYTTDPDLLSDDYQISGYHEVQFFYKVYVCNGNPKVEIRILRYFFFPCRSGDAIVFDESEIMELNHLIIMKNLHTLPIVWDALYGENGGSAIEVQINEPKCWSYIMGWDNFGGNPVFVSNYARGESCYGGGCCKHRYHLNTEFIENEPGEINYDVFRVVLASPPVPLPEDIDCDELIGLGTRCIDYCQLMLECTSYVWDKSSEIFGDSPFLPRFPYELLNSEQSISTEFFTMSEFENHLEISSFVDFEYPILINVYNSIGNVVISEKINIKPLFFNISYNGLPNGSYYVLITSNNYALGKFKFIIVK